MRAAFGLRYPLQFSFCDGLQRGDGRGGIQLQGSIQGCEVVLRSFGQFVVIQQSVAVSGFSQQHNFVLWSGGRKPGDLQGRTVKIPDQQSQPCRVQLGSGQIQSSVRQCVG